MTHYNIKISGKVQGVFFRKYTKQKADELGIKGFVRNEPDGSVYIEAEGGRNPLNRFVDWCHSGSPEADVTDVTKEKGDLKDFVDFSIEYI